MLKQVRTALFKHLFSVAYLALVFGACVLNAPIAIAFFSFFAPIGAVASALLIPVIALIAFLKKATPEKFQAEFAKMAAEVRAESFLSRGYRCLFIATVFSMLIIGLHPVYAFFYLVGAASVYTFRALVQSV